MKLLLIALLSLSVSCGSVEKKEDIVYKTKKVIADLSYMPLSMALECEVPAEVKLWLYEIMDIKDSSPGLIKLPLCKPVVGVWLPGLIKQHGIPEAAKCKASVVDVKFEELANKICD